MQKNLLKTWNFDRNKNVFHYFTLIFVCKRKNNSYNNTIKYLTSFVYVVDKRYNGNSL